MTAPCDGTYTIVNNITCTNCRIDHVYNIASGSLTSGSRLTWPYPDYTSAITFINSNSYTCIISGSYGWLVVPAASSSIISTNYPTTSRVNTVINNYAIKNEDNTYNYITNKPIFDEDTLIFYNPLTGVSFNVTGWHYDYSTRRYTLTYTDNSVSKTATVEYGYNYITVTADGAASNYYYLA